MGLGFAVSPAAPASPRPRPGAPASAQGLARLKASRRAASLGACSSGGTWAFVHPESHGWGHDTTEAVLGARTEGSLFPSHFTQNKHCTMCPSLQLPAPWAAGSTDGREHEPRRCWMGAGLHLLPQAACSCPPHTHAPLHVVKVWKRLLSNHPAPPEKKNISRKVARVGEKK